MATREKAEVQISDIEEFRKELTGISSIAGISELKRRIKDIEKKLEDEQDFTKVKELMREKVSAEKKVKRFEEVEKLLGDVEGLYELWVETGDSEVLKELNSTVEKFRREMKKLKIEVMLRDTYDRSNAIVEITPGAGGTESMDWAEMLFRMYSRWAAESGFDVKVVDKLPGERAGIKSITFIVEGEYAYGYLKGESGIHRLVRISPFDASRRRHTSFAAVTVYPDIQEDVDDIQIDPKDLQIETFRASGPGGQHVNKTDSAVRIKHIPTGIVVTCQNERSQYRNKQTALRILKARLLELERKKKKEEKEKMVEKKEIAWGNQIRSYVLYPYKLVKDHRTGYETPLAEKVLDGEIDEFIESYLKHLALEKQGKRKEEKGGEQTKAEKNQV